MSRAGASRWRWTLVGLATGVAGLATSYAAAEVLGVRRSPMVAVAEGVIELTPGPVVRAAIGLLGFANKPVLVAGVLVITAGLFAAAGLLARGGLWRGALVYAAMAAAGAWAVLTGPGVDTSDLLPVLVGLVTWIAVLFWLAGHLGGQGDAVEPGPESGGELRRTFLVRIGVAALLAGGVALMGRFAGAGRRTVEASRRMLRLDGVTAPPVPDGAEVGLEGVEPWQTAAEDFYLIHTAIAIPTIEPAEWRLRVHGMVDRELSLSYQDLLDRDVSEAWITLNCVSNEVGGSLVGNAWWSGVRIADVLAEAGVRDGADAVLQTSDDGWTCGTPLEVLTDDRSALLAVAMNGEPLPLEHGFPVRMIVPGLYGFVSATKWLVDLEVSRFSDFDAYWTPRGWSERAPVKIASRIDVPRSGDSVPAGKVRVGGSACLQHTGIRAVEVAVDGRGWQPVELAGAPSRDTWVQWVGTVTLEPGEHELRVRAQAADGTWQTGAQQAPAPDGATGWHRVVVVAE